jgi:Domain of unknown function DUF29
LLRDGRVGDLDHAAAAEEIDDVGEEQYFRLESALRLRMHHLMKWDHQPVARNRSWAITVLEQRRRVERQLRKNPGLKGRLDEALADAWEDARDEAPRARRDCRRGPFPRIRRTSSPKSWSGRSFGRATRLE